MRVKVAKNAGFCMGVRRAIDLVLNAARDRQPDEIIHTYGPLIHNNQVLEMLETRGIRCLANLEEVEKGRIAIRAHGIPPQERKEIKEQGFKIINATCPRVARVQGIIKKHALQGYDVVIVGDDNHAEVIGLKGFANGRARVLNKREEVDQLPEMEKLLVVAQTTQDERAFKTIADRLRERYPGAKIFNTICDSTHNRQEEVRALCDEVEAMVVVGGRQSGNTKRLAEIAAATGIPTFHVETAEELDQSQLQEFDLVGVTAGASTPNWLLRRVVYELESIEPPGARPLARTLERYMRFSLQSNLYVASGAGCLSYAAAVLQGIKPRLVDFAITVLYVFAMHVLNRYADKAARFNDPSRAAFYERYKIIFFLASVGAVFVALLLALSGGVGVFLALLAMTVLGLLYSVRIFPERWLRFVRVVKLKDIPASKTIFIASGWSAVVTLLPGLRGGWNLGWSTLFALVVIFILVFVRSALFDVMDIQGDRLVGEETIPIVIGEKRTRRLLIYLVLALSLLLLVAPSLGLATGFSYLLLITCCYMGFYLFVHQRELLRPGSLRFEGLVENSFYLAGGLAVIYQFSVGM
ncbi:MAG: 4-hydroxy-3-methylbut-2-enyl diphosphate reductase [Deltaproteobacteria bacterium]|nr:MAG: 4-hydroxy-3-methylbut-2-enyl diphosphate reductase [Deltaproteobacteria bacterium]